MTVDAPRAPPAQRAALARRAGPVRRVLAAVVSGLAVATLWLALVLPPDLRDVGVDMLVQVPLEGLLLVAAALWLPWASRRRVVLGVGLLLGAVVVVELVDLAFDAVFDRPLDLVDDGTYLSSAFEVLTYSVGRGGAVAAAVAVGLLALGLVLLGPAVLGRVVRVVRSHTVRATQVLAVLTALWVLGAVLDWESSPRNPVASWNVADRVWSKAEQTASALADRRTFQREIDADAFAGVPDDQLLTALRGKDVAVVFVESYGRVAVEDPELSPGVDRVLDDGTSRLEAAGFGACSAFLSSATYGAASWLAHATVQTGLWVDSQHRYNRLLSSDRATLTGLFGRAGWRTVVMAPAITKPWPEGQRFYGYDRLYDGDGMGYAGPLFGFDSVPDQFTLSALQRRELAPGERRPVFAQVDLISSHHPWTPLPPVVPWSEVGDGSVFGTEPAVGPSEQEAFSDPDLVRAAYGRSVEYSLEQVLGFVEAYGGRDLVVLMVGDHQPHSYVSGVDAGHDVPITLIAQDPRVLRRIGGWGWEPGLNPGPQAPVTRMDTFRDRFLTAFGPGGTGSRATSCAQ